MKEMKSGFTLIELLGILAILGIIIIVAMPSLIRSNQMAKKNEVKDACNIISTACDSYRVFNPTATGVTVSMLKSQELLKSDFTIPSGMGSFGAGTNITITKSGCTMPSVCND